jgi:hypothetical protein
MARHTDVHGQEFFTLFGGDLTAVAKMKFGCELTGFDEFTWDMRAVDGLPTAVITLHGLTIDGKVPSENMVTVGELNDSLRFQKQFKVSCPFWDSVATALDAISTAERDARHALGIPASLVDCGPVKESIGLMQCRDPKYNHLHGQNHDEPIMIWTSTPRFWESDGGDMIRDGGGRSYVDWNGVRKFSCKVADYMATFGQKKKAKIDRGF